MSTLTTEQTPVEIESGEGLAIQLLQANFGHAVQSMFVGNQRDIDSV